MHAAASVLVSARVIAISVLMVEVIILSLFVLGPREGTRGVVGVAGVTPDSSPLLHAPQIPSYS